MSQPRQLDEGIWVFDHPLRVFGFAVGARMTAVRLEDGGLFLHSPIPFDADTRAALDSLGPVRHVVAPNKVHHFYVAQARAAYPDAHFYAAPGLPEKRRDLAFDAVLGESAPDAWAGQLDQEIVGGIPYVNEVAFFHIRSRTLLLTDLAFNMFESRSWLTRTFLRMNGIYGRFGPSRMMRSLVRDRAQLRASIDRILCWDFERVVVSHGIVLQRAGRRVLRESYAWL